MFTITNFPLWIYSPLAVGFSLTFTPSRGIPCAAVLVVGSDALDACRTAKRYVDLVSARGRQTEICLVGCYRAGALEP